MPHLKEGEKPWDAAETGSHCEVLWVSQSGSEASKDWCWTGGCVGQSWLVAGPGAKPSFAEGKKAGRPAAAQAGRGRLWQVRGRQKKKKKAKRGTGKENLPTRKLILAASVTTLTARQQLCQPQALPWCPDAWCSEHAWPLPLESTDTDTWKCQSRWETMHTATLWSSTSPWRIVEQWELKASFEAIRWVCRMCCSSQTPASHLTSGHNHFWNVRKYLWHFEKIWQYFHVAWRDVAGDKSVSKTTHHELK